MKQTFRTLDLAIKLYKEASKLKLGNAVMQNQYDRALLSIVLNLSEGSAKPTKRDRRKFYYISYGSFREVSTLLELRGINQFNKQLNILGAHLWKLAQNPAGT